MAIKNVNFPFFSDTRVINDMAKEDKYNAILDNLIPFEEEGILTDTLTLQKSYDGITIVEDKPIEAGANLRNEGDGRVVTFRSLNFIIEGLVSAIQQQSIIDVYTGELLDTLDAKIEQRFASDILSIKSRLTQIKFGLFRGVMLDHNGNVVGDLYSDFGYQRHPTVSIALNSTVDDFAAKIREIFVLMQKNTYGRVMTQKPLMLVDVNTYNAIANIVRTTSQYVEMYFTTVGPNEVITRFAIDIAAIYGEYNGVSFIESGKGYVVPRGVPGYYLHKLAPPTLNSASNLNQIASQMFYAMRIPNKYNSGFDVVTQSRSIPLISDPRMLVQVDFNLP